MEQIKLSASLREGVGKEKVKKLRRAGLIPGVVYHRGEKSVSIEVSDRDLNKILHSHENENVLINLTIEKDKKTTEGSPERSRGKSRAVIIKEIQHDPVRRNILHVDFNEISLTETILVEVEIVAKGESIGVKQDGGFLDRPLRHIKIQCLPTDIPAHLDVDVSGLKLNDVFHVKDLVVSEKIKVVTDPESLLFQVKKIEEKVEETLEPGQTPEIEVIREKKEEEGGKAEVKEEVKAKEALKTDKK